MSDDTPTQRFDAPGDAPTERLGAPGGAPTERLGAAAPSEEVVEERKSRRLITILGIIGGVLLVAVLIVLILLLTRGSGTPTTPPTNSSSPSASSSSTPTPTPSTATTTPTATPTASQTQAAPPPPDTSVRFTSLDPVKKVECYYSEAPNFSPPPIKIEVSWTSKNANVAWFAANSDDASADQYMQIPTNGNQDNFQYEIDYPCYQKSISYTITLVGDDNEKSTKKWTVTNTGYVSK